MIEYIEQKIANLFPGYFSLVMATGALSVATFLLDIPWIPQSLLVFNMIAYVTLWLLTLIRLVKYFPRVLADLTSHTLGPGFFTFVAATCMLGSQLIIVADNYYLAAFLWVFGILLWITIMYTFFTAVTVRRKKPTLAAGINGAWLIAAVATQSISILGTLLSPYMENGREIILFFTLCMYLLGCMLYLNIITLIFYRFTFLELKYASLTPPYWINMGAVAITTLAGSTLILHVQKWPLLIELTPFLKGFTLFFWITGTWWIPLLFSLMIWRHLYHRYPLTYDPQFWGMAFPLAMYTTGTFQLAKALKIPFLMFIPRFMVVIAMFAWLTVFAGFIRCQFRSFKNINPNKKV
ncbi:tellurite resistance/C4-dicarboxylate transporter family protein [Fodinisporobacter ferrooxydans]|uniref:Tellurite resistance/C4-dicarboxylate transporter family protein n=1 Tax=Fodinisporobacter ferrooxydans TaxID=2901836 RepID=A0ABY4CN42_9BACL|nr:tellurite resistance/C4-dicarboxylate transporter family protein [Alicyclobacillaceae bacterium MYW30-H2]